MLVKDYINTLGFGVLSNLGSVVDEDTLKVKEPAIPRIIHFINEGLIKLYSEFPLKIDSLFLQVHESRTNYPITSEHQMTEEEYVSNCHYYDKYIWKGFEETFQDDLLSIEKVFSHTGNEIPLNAMNNRWSAFTPMYNVLELPANFPAGMVSVLYRARHKKVIYEENTNIELPDVLFDALANYIAYKLYTNLNTEVSVQNANKYLTEYNNLIESVKTNGIVNPDYNPDFNKFYERGWC